MSPTRRVLLAIGALVVLMVAGLLLSWHLQERALGEALVADITATMARPIERSAKPESFKHENGYACFAGMVDVTPKDLSPFEMKDSEVLKEVMDAGVMPEALLPKVTSLEPWAESMRACGDSEQLKFVDGVTPFASFGDAKSERGNQALLALSRLTRLQARMLARDEQWQTIAERCAGTLEVALDRSHVNLIGAMIAASAVKQLSPQCGVALQRASAEARPALAKRFGALPSRLVSSREVVEVERQTLGLMMYGWRLSSEVRATLPSGEQLVAEEWWPRFMSARLWSRWDRSMRQLSVAAEQGEAARLDASRAHDRVMEVWWAPAELSGQPDYEKFFVRLDETALLLRALSELAAAREVTLSPKLARTAEGVEFTDFKGEKLLIPLL